MLKAIKANSGNLSSAKCIIIMPIYNRRHFLKQAFRSLDEQTYIDWELIVVDDGSTDNPFDEVKKLANDLTQPVTYVRQDNSGPGTARATGQTFLNEQDFVAFFDSDDYWLPNYLEDSIQHLKKNYELDWIYCPCRRVDYSTGHTLSKSTFEHPGTKKPLDFLSLNLEKTGDVFIFRDNSELAISHLKEPINAGFQNSVMKARVLQSIQIPNYRIGEDRYFLMAAILNGFKIGFIERVSVIYNVHGNNISDTNPDNVDIEKAIGVQKELCRSYKDLKNITKNEKILKEANKQVSKILFWQIGYNLYWNHGYVGGALSHMLHVLLRNPKNPTFIKTFLLCLLRSPFVVFINLQRRTRKIGG